MKQFSTLFLSAIIVVGFGACSSKQDEVEVNEIVQVCMQDGVKAPSWTCNPEFQGSIAAVGIAKMNAGNDKSFQRAEALADGRDALATQIEVKTNNLFKSYKAITGTGNDATYDNSSSKVSKQVASQTLNGSKAVAVWQHPSTKELYLLVTVSSDSVKNDLKEGVKTSFQNDKAIYQKLIADEASGELEKELEKAYK